VQKPLLSAVFRRLLLPLLLSLSPPPLLLLLLLLWHACDSLERRVARGWRAHTYAQTQTTPAKFDNAAATWHPVHVCNSYVQV